MNVTLNWNRFVLGWMYRQKTDVMAGERIQLGVCLLSVFLGPVEFDWTWKANGHRAAGESAVPAVTGTGMECGHAAPQGAAPSKQPAQAETANPRPALEGAAADQPRPAGAALPPHGEECAVKGEDGGNCPNPPVAGLRVNLYATPTMQKRYGRRVMLSLIFDLPVCLGCVSRITPDNLMTGEQWRSFSKVAQQRNSGVLADRSQTEIVLCQFDDPEYVALRRQIEQQRAAKDVQPAATG